MRIDWAIIKKGILRRGKRIKYSKNHFRTDRNTKASSRSTLQTDDPKKVPSKMWTRTPFSRSSRKPNSNYTSFNKSYQINKLRNRCLSQNRNIYTIYISKDKEWACQTGRKYRLNKRTTGSSLGTINRCNSFTNQSSRLLSQTSVKDLSQALP